MSETKTQDETPRPGFFRRHRRFFLVLGGIAAFLFLAFVVTAAVVLYKASRVFPRPLPDIVPASAAIYAETLEFPNHEPGIWALADNVRGSPEWKSLPARVPWWRELDMDRKIDQAREGLDRIEEQTGIDLAEAFAGSETAVAVFLPAGYAPNPGADGKTSPPDPSYLLLTRLATWPVRIGALFPSLVSRFLPSDRFQLQRVGRGFRLELAGGEKPLSFHLALLDDVLIVSDRADLIEETLDLAGADLPLGLSTDEIYQRSNRVVTPPAGAVVRFWTAFDKFDALTSIRRKAEFRIARYPYNYLGGYLNEIQRNVVDLEATEAAAGWMEIDPAGRVSLVGSLLYEGSAGGEATRAFGKIGDFGARNASQKSLALVEMQGAIPEIWAGVMRGGTEEEQLKNAKMLEEYGETIDRILAELGPDLAVFFQSHPQADARQGNPPVPWTGIAARCRDTLTVSVLLRELLQKEVDKVAKKLTEEPPVLPPPEIYRGAEITAVQKLPEGITSGLAPDFTPGFAVYQDRLMVFTSRAYAFEMIDALQERRPSLASTPVYEAMNAPIEAPPNFRVLLDGNAIADALGRLRYRMAIAELLLPPDWDEINAEIRARYGRDLSDQEFMARQDQYVATQLRPRQVRLAGDVAAMANILRLLRGIGTSGVYLVDAAGRPTGVEGRIDFLLAAK